VVISVKVLLLFSDRKQLALLLWSLSGCCVVLFRALKKNLGCTADKLQRISCTVDIGFHVPYRKKIGVLVCMLFARSIVSEIYITILSFVCKTGVCPLRYITSISLTIGSFWQTEIIYLHQSLRLFLEDVKFCLEHNSGLNLLVSDKQWN
jgi:hypothetical protein